MSKAVTCRTCQTLVSPPVPVCPICGGELAPSATAGAAIRKRPRRSSRTRSTKGNANTPVSVAPVAVDASLPTAAMPEITAETPLSPPTPPEPPTPPPAPSPKPAPRHIPAVEPGHRDPQASIELPIFEDPIIGLTVGNVQIVSLLGRGGMGTVYRAEHQEMKTSYAVKVLNPETSRPENAERFRREAVACSELRHPNVVFVTDFGFKAELGIYIIMEYLDGQPLSSLIRQENVLDPLRACRIALQICSALSAAHERGIIHRDLKSENIHICNIPGKPDFVKVLDFGIAQLKYDQKNLTAAGMVLGSPHYMSPEQVQGLRDKVGSHTDVYALGCILYELVTGECPFVGRNPIEICKKHIFEDPEPLSTHIDKLAGTRLEALVTQMLGKRIQERPASMVDVAVELKEAARELQARGLVDVHSGELARHADFDTISTPALTPEIVRADSMMRHIVSTWPESSLGKLVTSLSRLVEVDDSFLWLMLWGVLEREISEPELDDPRFETALLQLDALFTAALEPEVLSPGSSAFLRAVRDQISVLDNTRQRRIARQLQSWTAHPRFPQDVLPHWARVRTSGSWMMPSSSSDPSSSFFDKLRQPISLRSVRDVLSHNINPFRKAKPKKEQS